MFNNIKVKADIFLVTEKSKVCSDTETYEKMY